VLNKPSLILISDHSASTIYGCGKIVENALAFIIILLLFFATSSFSQSTTRIGEWTSYMSHSTGNFVAQSPEYVFFGSNGGLVLINKNNEEIKFVTKVSGLSDISVQTMAWDSKTNRLIIAYRNSNIDIYDPKTNKIVNLPDILRNTKILGDKIINRIYTSPGSDFAYLACGFGIVELNLKRDEFGFTAFTGIPVYEPALYKNLIYIATETGIYSIDKAKANPSDFGQWNAVSVFGSETYATMAEFNGLLFAVQDQTIYSFDGTTRTPIYKENSSNHTIQYLSSNKDWLLAGYRCKSDCDGKWYAIDKSNAVKTLDVSCVPRPLYAVLDEKNRGWFADRFQAFRSNAKITDPCSFKYFNTPLSAFSTDIALQADRIYVASGGINASYGYLFRGDGFFSYADGDWRVYNRGNNSVMQAYDLVDLFKMAIDNRTGLLYIGTYWGGLMQCDMKDPSRPLIKVFDKNNSSLQGAVGDAARTRIGGLTYDRKGNLWMTNYLAERPISVLKADGTWKNFATNTNTTLLACASDSANTLWFSVIGQGLLAFNPGDDLNNTSDDKYKLFNNGNSVLTTNNINAIATDLDGSVWVGTANGVFVFECGDVFDAACKGSKRIIVQLDLGGSLLENEDIQCIAIDGANRKWFGTRNGISVISAAGDALVSRYTKDNSPLYDNLITALRYHADKGEMYIGTGAGLQSLRIDATAGSRNNEFADIYAFPNPVRPEYNGLITIQGMRRNSTVKITDFAGQIVNQGKSNGGIYTWDGLDIKGKKVSSGIYIAWISAGDGFESPDTQSLKIAIVR